MLTTKIGRLQMQSSIKAMSLKFWIWSSLWRCMLIPEMAPLIWMILPALPEAKTSLSTLKPVFDSSYKICADYKLQLQLIERDGLSAFNAGLLTTKMRIGGASTSGLIAIINSWRESARAHREVHGSLGIYPTFRKVFSKFKQYYRKDWLGIGANVFKKWLCIEKWITEKKLLSPV